MKVIFVLMLIFATIQSQGQIILENTYKTGVEDNQAFITVKLSSSGYKYVSPDLKNGTIMLYNLDHTLFKELSYSTSKDYVIDYCLFISETLFNTDTNDVEFLIRRYNQNTHVSSVFVFNEDNEVLFYKDSVNLTGYEYLEYTPTISYTSAGPKLILSSQFSDEVYIYSLPGNSEGSLPNLVQETSLNEKRNISVPFPNPTLNDFKIKYILPQGISKANMSFYDLKGKKLKTIDISSNANIVNVSKSMLGVSSGVYVYKIYNGNTIISTEKIILQ